MRRHRGDVFHIHQQLPKLSDMQWLLEDLVHSTCQCSIDVLVFDVAGDGDDLWLVRSCHLHLVVKSSDFLGCFITIHEGHVAVHEDQ